MSRKSLEKIYYFSKKLLLYIAIFALVYTSFDIYQSQRQVILFEEDTEFGRIWVYEQNNIKCLSFLEPKTTNAFQTCINIKNPDEIILSNYKVIFESLFSKNRIDHILLVGLGGGTLPRAIQNSLPYAKLDIVEINPSVANIAFKFFDFKMSKNTKLYIENITKFVEPSKLDQYDAIILDAFNSHDIPEDLVTKIFIINITQKLKPGGILIVNTLMNSSVQYELKKLITANLQYELIQNSGLNRIYIFSSSEICLANSVKEHNK